MSQTKETIFKSNYEPLDIPEVSIPHFILDSISKLPDQSKAAFIDGSGDKRSISFAQYGVLVKKVLYPFNDFFSLYIYED